MDVPFAFSSIDNASGSRKEHCLEMDMELEFLGWLKLNDALRSEVALFIMLLEGNESFGCCIAGGRGSSFICISLFSVSVICSVSDFPVLGCSGDFAMATVFDGGVDASKSLAVSNGSDDGERGDGFFRNRTPHIAVTIATLAANPTAKNDKYRSGCSNKRLSAGTLLPMTNIQLLEW